jgi:predicted ABC-type transport system involved in lysophospholipase L1 biosynthesis ATPase subunit
MMITDSAAQQKAVTTSRISLSGVHKRFGDLEVLKGVDIDVEPGEVVVLIGASGSASAPPRSSVMSGWSSSSSTSSPTRPRWAMSRSPC